jgi:excisionase family DNA binding protein
LSAEATDERVVYDVPEVSKKLGIGINQAYQMVREGKIPSIRLQRRIVIPRAAFERWLAGEVAYKN